MDAQLCMHRDNDIEFKHELVRKSIHLFSLAIPIGYLYLPRDVTLDVLLAMVIVSLVLDFGRHYSASLAHYFYKLFRPLLREHELDTTRKLLNGASYVLISAVVCVQFFPKLITVASFTVLIVSDTAAALYGRRFGKHRFFQKSLEGTGAFFISALLVLLLMPHAHDATAEFLVGATGALVGAIVESASIALHVDDNLSIPLSMAGTMWGLFALLAWINPTQYQALYDAVVAFQ